MTEREQSNPPLMSTQVDVHPDLARVVTRHLATPWQKPVPTHTREAGDRLMSWLRATGKPLILDSYCGTGHSTAHLAALFPDHAIVGVDKSAARLSRHAGHGDYLLLRAECEPLWQLLLDANITLARHYLLYPNPWPKPGQFKRRVHGHPGFAALVRLGGDIELRTNWCLYAREFDLAMRLAGISGAFAALPTSEPISLFEQKYAQREQDLWQWQSARSPSAQLASP